MIYTNKIENPADANGWTRAYLDSILVEMRLLDSCVPDTSCTIFGRKFATPVMTAAFSHLDRMHEGGMITMAQGAAEAHALNWAGMGSAEELEGILGACPETVTWSARSCSMPIKPARSRSAWISTTALTVRVSMMWSWAWRWLRSAWTS